MKVNSIKGTVGNNLVNVISELQYCNTVQEVKDLVMSCIPENRLYEDKVQHMIEQLNNCRTVDKAYAVVTNFVLAGDNMKVV